MTHDEAMLIARKTMDQEIEAIRNLADAIGDAFMECARLLANCRGLIWVTGVGTSSAVGMRFAHLLTCCGARSMFLSPADGLHGHTGVMSGEDVLVALSRGGESVEVNQMTGIAKERGVATVAFVHTIESSLAMACDLVVPIRSRQDHELMGHLATTSTVAYSAVCDALCAIVLESKGYTPEQFGKTHPGGAVGRKLATGSNDSARRP